jgi:uncharacterized RDD family membrane protein YckC
MNRSIKETTASATEEENLEPPSRSDSNEPHVARYATFTRRFRALIVDTAIVFGVIIVVVIVGDAADSIPGSGRLAWLLMFAALFLYEPLFIWRRGATIGHTRNQLTVIDDRTGRRPGLAQAFARYCLKVILGIPSFVTMALTRKHQAVHDLLTRTTVQLAADADAQSYEFHLERTEDATTRLPSRLRRAVVMVLYLIAIFVTYGVLVSMLVPLACLRDQSCTAGTRLLTDAVTLVWLGASLAAVVAAWKGFLPGART